jgi:protein involved in polysaccharide export with SLBB domain
MADQGFVSVLSSLDDRARSVQSTWSPAMPNASSRALLLFAFLVGACSAPGRPESTTSHVTLETQLDWSEMTLGPNDIVSLTVAGRPEYSSPINGWRVDTSGFLNIPIVGPVQVADCSVQGAQTAIEEAFRRYLREPSVALSVLEWQSREYYVLGQVRQPGPYKLTRPMTLFEAFSQSRGFANGADREHVYLLRPHGSELEVFEFNGQTPDPSGLVVIQPRDIIFVRQTGWSTFQEQLLPIINAFGVTTINFSGTNAHNQLLGD